jgi:hypothetical protein
MACSEYAGGSAPNKSNREKRMTRILLGSFVVAVMLLGSGQIIRAEDTVMFPDVKGKMVRISIAHSYEKCMKNGRYLGYPDSDSHAWCSQHCDGKICQ